MCWHQMQVRSFGGPRKHAVPRPEKVSYLNRRRDQKQNKRCPNPLQPTHTPC
jgi:hypothetical protein